MGTVDGDGAWSGLGARARVRVKRSVRCMSRTVLLLQLETTSDVRLRER